MPARPGLPSPSSWMVVPKKYVSRLRRPSAVPASILWCRSFPSEIAACPLRRGAGFGLESLGHEHRCRHQRRQAAPTAALAPPHNLEAEQSVLGAILLSDHSMYALVIEEGLRADDFYRDRHRWIYEAMLALYEESEPVDVLTVIERLRQTGKLDEVGGLAVVDELTGVVPAAGHARRYAQIVRENALLRRLLASTYEIQESVLGH